MEHCYDIIVIGGGPAGYTAALYAARAGRDVLVLERMSPGGQMALTGVIENYPGFDEGVDGFTLGMKMQQGAERFGAKTEYAQVVSVDFSQPVKKIITENGDFFAKAVIVAVGANPKALSVEGEAELVGQGVHYCAHCDGRFYKGKTVVVVGGGNSAVSDATYLSNLAQKVYLVHRRDTLRATQASHEPLKNAENVEFLWNTVVEGFVADGHVTGVKLRNLVTQQVSELPCDGVFVSIGRVPATEFLRDMLPLDDNGYVRAAESTMTPVHGVFVAGDARTKILRQIVTAVSDGAVASHHAEEYLAQVWDGNGAWPKN